MSASWTSDDVETPGAVENRASFVDEEARIQGALGARAPRVKQTNKNKKEEEEERGKKRGKEGGEREIMFILLQSQ